MKENIAICTNVKALLYSLLDHTVEVPAECVEWEQEDVLLKRWQTYHTPEQPSESSSEAIPKAK
jgi:hypothetical protein